MGPRHSKEFKRSAPFKLNSDHWPNCSHRWSDTDHTSTSSGGRPRKSDGSGRPVRRIGARLVGSLTPTSLAGHSRLAGTRPAKERPQHRLIVFERRRGVRGIEGRHVVTAHELLSELIVLVAPELVAGVSVPTYGVPEVVALKDAVLKHHEVVALAHPRLENGSRNVGVIERSEHVTHIVQKGAYEICVVAAVRLGAMSRLQAVGQAVDGEATVLVVEQAQLSQQPIGQRAQVLVLHCCHGGPLLGGGLVHPGEVRSVRGCRGRHTLILLSSSLGAPQPSGKECGIHWRRNRSAAKRHALRATVCPSSRDLSAGTPGIYGVSECHHFRPSTITP